MFYVYNLFAFYPITKPFLSKDRHRKRKDEIVSLSLEHSVISPLTSFVAIEERDKGEKIQKTVDVETLIKKITVDSLPYMSYSLVEQVWYFVQ